MRLFSLCLLLHFALARDDNNTQGWTEVSWGNIQPSQDLQWVPCYTGDYQCTRLQVRLDYYHDDESSEGNSTAAIALIRLPANVSKDSPEYRGPVLFNPGGPGVSGVGHVLDLGTRHRAVLGPQFDVVGFDPRGVQRSTPRIEFYETPAERAFNYRPLTELNHSSSENVASYWGHTKTMGALAYERGKEYLPYMNTEFVARDMLKIVEAHGKEKLMYWGFSYGCTLGYTFASMFPDKVERMVLDGVPDDEDYYTATWLNGLQDADESLNWFFRACQEADPTSCPFYEESVEAIEDKFSGILRDLLESPIPVWTNGSSSYGLIDYAFLRNHLFLGGLLNPGMWHSLAEGLQALAEGDATVFYSTFKDPPFECDCGDASNFGQFAPNPEANAAYICNDGDAVPPELEAAYQHYRRSAEVSSFGSIYSCVRIQCNGWSSEIPKARFRGPIAGNTSFPILFIGNTADSLIAAVRSDKGFSELSGICRSDAGFSWALDSRNPHHLHA
ncbi:hypothetical protein PM082_023498 [Marasmius tenuissimus]|nr:hypothetical protein PM082_023498 [Marasmius tenuissimus]